MSILEKIDFLTKLPHNMPRTLCLIEANGKTYRGVIVGRKNNAIFLRTTSNGALGRTRNRRYHLAASAWILTIQKAA